MTDERGSRSDNGDATGPSRLEEELGVHETDQIDPDTERDLSEARREYQTSGLMVRGAENTTLGIKLSTLVTAAVLVAVVGALGGAIYWGGGPLWRTVTSAVGGADGSDEGTPALAERARRRGWLYCHPESVDPPRAPAALRAAPAVVMGDKQYPRSRSEIRAIAGARTDRRDGDRVDLFQPDQAHLQVRYRGDGPSVRWIRVRLGTPLSGACSLLAYLHLLPAPAAFAYRPDSGLLDPRAGQPAAYFRAGGQLAVVVREDRVVGVGLRPSEGDSP